MVNMTTKIENIILRNMLYNDDYVRAVLPHIKSEYFGEERHKHIFIHIEEYMLNYNKRPTKEALDISVQKDNKLGENIFQDIKTTLSEYKIDEKLANDADWLLTETEKWCKSRSVANAVMECIGIIDGSDKKLTIDSMPDILKDALGVSFDSSIGHDFLDDAEERYDFYNTSVERIPFALDYFNRITGGGIPNKTLNILMGGTGGFKSGTMCSFASDYLMLGKNVLYITLELAEERVAERIDANLLDTSLDDLKTISRADYIKRVDAIRAKTIGKLVIKEYPTASAHTGHFKHLLRELELKKDFKPDVIFVDYINIMASSRTTMAGGSYGYIKAIAEELRGMAVEFNVPIWSATQTNRGGISDSDVGLENTSESMGLPSTADLYLAIINTEDLTARGQLLFKQLKNRFGDVNKHNKFVVGKDGGKMRLFDAEDAAQDLFNQDHSSGKSSKQLIKEAQEPPKFGQQNTLADKREAVRKINF